jgi:hypothetical protein
MGDRGRPDDRQAEPGAAVAAARPRVVQRGEPVERPFRVLRGDARPVVGDRDQGPAVTGADGDPHLAARVAQRVVDQVEQHPAEPLRVTGDAAWPWRVRGHRYPGLRVAGHDAGGKVS